MANGTSSESVTFTGLLTILFIALKLMHYTNWSWWWVLSPLWIGLAVVLGIFMIWTIVYLIDRKNKLL